MERKEITTPDKVYVIKENINTCKGCDREEDLRFGYCFDCANVQSVILGGLDMNDKGLDGNGLKAEKSLDKVRLLYQLGLLSYAKPESP